MNKSKGNMYPFVSHTYNAIRGVCPHDCIYCYCKGFKVGPLRLDIKALNENLGSGNYIFVGSSTDMFADKVPREWILDVLKHCRGYDNKYLFQTKNPARFLEFLHNFPENTVFGTTIESDIDYGYTKAPNTYERRNIMLELKCYGKPIMLSIEPIIHFNVDILTDWVKQLKPDFVSIGADSKNHNLPEPDGKTLKEFIGNLNGITLVVIKSNLHRIWDGRLK